MNPTTAAQPFGAGVGFTIPDPSGETRCTGRAVRQLAALYCECQCGALVEADVVTGQPLRHERQGVRR